MKVYVDPACNINYCSFYIKGLWDIFDRNNVIMSSRYFKDLRYTTETHYLAFTINGRKYVIDCADSNQLFFDCFLEWADVYGKVNYKEECLPERWKGKITHVGPNFGWGCFGRNKWEASIKCIANYLKCHNRLDYPFSSYLSPYLWLYKRNGIDWSPKKSTVGSRKIFFVSRYWEGQEWVNTARINFIRACKRLEANRIIDFEGGLVPDHQENNCPPDVMMTHEIPINEYIDKLDQSLLVFNTPAYHKCHGWKLPEYLSQGRIILSTPFENELPIPLEHRNNIFFTDQSQDSIYASILEIVNNTSLQKILENGSRQYWDNNASPKSCLTNFLNENN